MKRFEIDGDMPFGIDRVLRDNGTMVYKVEFTFEEEDPHHGKDQMFDVMEFLDNITSYVSRVKSTLEGGFVRPEWGFAANRVYIAGPMRGYPQFNFPAFFEAEEEVMVALGADVGLARTEVEIFNPARRDLDHHGPDVMDSDTGDLEELAEKGITFDLRSALSADTDFITRRATHIYMLKGWENSSGARAERALAQALGLEVMYQEEGTLPHTPEERAAYEEGRADGQAEMELGQYKADRGV